MAELAYASVPGDENLEGPKSIFRSRSRSKDILSVIPTAFYISVCLIALALIAFTTGVQSGRAWEHHSMTGGEERSDGLLKPEVFIGTIPRKDVMFHFPTAYEDTSKKGDEFWDNLMPLGAGFLRVPHPRIYAMPRSTKIANDPEDAELYSVSMTHQLHCLAVLRHVIIKYEKGDKSRFAGAGHEYHCIDYIRQAILCAGDTTLDHAEIEYNPDGSERRYGFDGANATHRCRDWDFVRRVLIEKRFDNKTGILF